MHVSFPDVSGPLLPYPSRKQIAMYFQAFFILLVLFPAFYCHADDGKVRIMGRVFSEKGPLAGARVLLYGRYEDIHGGKSAYISEPTDDNGLYSLEISPGHYYFTARHEKDGRIFFAFHGNNPILMGRTNAWVAFMAHEVKEPRFREGEMAVRGSVTFKGEPVPGAYVSAYLANAPTFKGLGFKTESADDKGAFAMSLPAGNFVFVAKHLKGSQSMRPLQRGDLIGYFPLNPVEVRAGREAVIEIPCYPRGDRSAFVDAPVIKDNDYTILEDLARLSGVGVKGRVTDEKGNPIAGIYVLAYEARSPVFQMYHLSHGTPFSARTEKDGTYFIPLHAEGDYHMVARNILGDGPHRDEVYGLYQGNAMHGITFKAGTLLENIDIVAGVTMERDIEKKMEQPARLADPEYHADATIEKDSIWAGNVLIQGKVSVKRGVTLVVEPGARIRFKKLDRDENGIGDGEILVEGNLIARGKKEAPIVFTSAENKPAARDWSYVNVLATGGENIFEHCVFEYGFSGMQLHYSNAAVRNCLFHRNGEGLHFNTVNIVAEYNTFTGNGVGIKFSRLEGDVTVRHNIINHNDIGILFVHQHINAVNFDNLHKVIEPPLFTLNNIHENRKYNFSMGDLQKIDIEVPHNWWGADTAEAIEKTIFHKKDDEELGEVFYTSYLPSPLENIGMNHTVAQ